MNGYLLLDEPVLGSSNKAYRGVYRPEPKYIEELPVDSSVNQLWMMETDLMIGFPLASLEEAQRVQSIYAESGVYLDLVVVGEKDWSPVEANKHVYMGVDIAHVSSYSLLSWDLVFDRPSPEFFHQREEPKYLALLILIQNYFHPLLNNFRLFSSLSDAELFLHVTEAMTNGFGSVWESVEYGAFNCVKMYMVKSREEIKAQYGVRSPTNE